MKMGGGALLVALGLVILWVAVTGKLGNLGAAWRTLNLGESATTGGGVAPAGPVAAWSQAMPLPALPGV